MHPAAVGVPAEVRSCTGKGAQEKLAQLRMAGGRGSLFSGVKRNGTEQAQDLGLIDLWRQVPDKEERQWEPLGRKCSGAREPVCRSSDSVSVGAGPSCSHREPLHCSGESGAAPLCLVKHLCAILWSLQHVQCNSHSKQCSPSCWLCHGVRALLVRRGLSLLRWRGACSHGAVGWCWCQRKRLCMERKAFRFSSLLCFQGWKLQRRKC